MDFIEFPGLGIKFNIDPIAYTIGPFEVHWYGIILAIGFLAAFLVALKTCQKYGLTQDNVIDMLLIALPLAVVCARIFYVIIFPKRFNSFIEIIQIWNGGISIYGGIIGGIAGVVIYSKIKKLNMLDFLDFAAPLMLLGQAIGRWGNFVNQELYGKQTDFFLRMTGNRINGAVHPTFLYESILNLIAFIVLVNYRSRKKFKGEVFYLYIAVYSLIRFSMEFIRVDMADTFKANQVIALICMVVFGAFVIIGRMNNKNTLSTQKDTLNDYKELVNNFGTENKEDSTSQDSKEDIMGEDNNLE